MMHAANAYAKTSRSVLSPREAEAAVLIKAANRLQTIRAGWPEQERDLNEALTFNRKVWTVIAGDATEPTNPLPEALKQNVGKLAIFVFRSTLDMMIEPKAETLDALISINHNIAAGLQGDSGR
ncbi:flagellar protein FlaF [Methylobacterium sp. BE186]|uniref:flagellar biosynthesis regulator FlaF n=1 Tax=Methylobacterium sp. BE186 TaxID=2817715 RepID=UPI002862D14C|nr:flagellar biosynthesis regulator FlaF [Methylobacterium sp. BE186]MDR7036972.1 flagellar protein FlaF [Methylobacterium sp. BE186]